MGRVSSGIVALFVLSPGLQAQLVPLSSHPGLVIQGQPHAVRLGFEAQVKKCRRDSPTFNRWIDTVALRTIGTSKTVTFDVAEERDSMVGHARQAVGLMYVDMRDLEVLADPARAPSGAFVLSPGQVGWSSTVCGWIGHEMAEMLKDVLANGRNRAVHHYQVANRVEDEIIRDYFGVLRTRRQDCWQPHPGAGHNDILLEIVDVGVERWHPTRDRLTLDTKGQVRGSSPSGRLAWIQPETGAQFRGRAAGNTACR